MTRETLKWLEWLVTSQSVLIGAEGAQAQTERAFTALAEIRLALTEMGN